MEGSQDSRFRVVVAGQVPPPVHGQAIYIQQTLTALANYPDLQVEHLEFRFSRSMSEIRRATLWKALESIRVALRLINLRRKGRIDLLLYPVGGPHVVPLVRDIILLPLCLILSRRLVLNFHATGIAEALPRLPVPLAKAARFLYGCADGALVLTEAGRKDPAASGIEHVEVVPNGLPDSYSAGTRSRSEITTLLYVGHLCPDKGTAQLLQAVARLKDGGEDAVRLILVGEPSPPWTDEILREEIRRLEIEGVVELRGVQMGDAKWEAFDDADIFVFPSSAPYEGFPLVLLEAMMWKLPIVTTRWKGIPEVVGIDGGATLVDPARLPDALAEAIGTLLSDRNSMSEMGEANRQRYLNLFTPEKVYSRLYSAIISFLSARR